MPDWKTIDTAPQGTMVKLRHEGAPAYDTSGQFKDGKWIMANLFLVVNRVGGVFMSTRPTHWAEMDPESASAA